MEGAGKDPDLGTTWYNSLGCGMVGAGRACMVLGDSDGGLRCEERHREGSGAGCGVREGLVGNVLLWALQRDGRRGSGSSAGWHGVRSGARCGRTCESLTLQPARDGDRYTSCHPSAPTT